MEEKKAREIKFENVSQQQHIDVNILRATILEVLEAEKGNLEELEKAYANHEEAKKWLEHAQKNYKSADKKFYEEKRVKQLEATNKQMESFELQISQEKDRVKEIETYLNFFDSCVVTEQKEDENKIVTTFTYDWKNLKPLVDLARIFNLGKNF